MRLLLVLFKDLPSHPLGRSPFISDDNRRPAMKRQVVQLLAIIEIFEVDGHPLLRRDREIQFREVRFPAFLYVIQVHDKGADSRILHRPR